MANKIDYEGKVPEMQARLDTEFGKGRYEVSYHKVNKNNDKVHHGYAIKEKDSTIAPQFYANGMDEEDIVSHIIANFRHFLETSNTPDTDSIKKLMTKDGIYSNVFPSLINTKKNKERLKDVAHRDYLDLAVIYKVCVGHGGYVTITNEMVEKMELSEKELYEHAIGNIQGTATVVNVLTMSSVDFDDDELPPLIVITNEDKCCGAGMILDSDAIALLESKLGDFYIIPSSIHEMIIVPTKMGDPDGLRSIIASVNDTEVPDDEVLSNNLYIYRNGKMEVA